MNLINGEIIFYGGLILAVITVVGILYSIVYLTYNVMKRIFQKSVKQGVTVLVVSFSIFGFAWHLGNSMLQQKIEEVQNESIDELFKNIAEQREKQRKSR